jgi:hypothetical protein
MFWKVAQFEQTQTPADFAPAGRFVVQRHRDAQGEHIDLRIEADGHLRGWRIDAATLGAGAWATEKAPHPLRWLDDDGAAVRVDAGEYCVEGTKGANREIGVPGALILRGAGGCMRVVMMPAPELPVAAARSIAEALHNLRAAPMDAARLIADGVAARQRATERLCGLARELDGDAFEERLCRKTLAACSLDEIHAQLRAYEVRFDAKYPPSRVSKPEAEGDAPRVRDAMAIARE